PSVSAGGSKVLYVSDNSGVRDLWSKDVNDKTEEPVTQFRPIGYRPALSADGKRVVYPSWQNGHCVVYMQSAAIASRPVALQGRRERRAGASFRGAPAEPAHARE